MMRMKGWTAAVGGMLLGVGAVMACTADAPASAAPGVAEAPPPRALPTQDITHLEPRPDFVGPQPERFTWSTAAAADSYMLRVWNEADVRVVSEAGLTTTTIDFPKEYDMPAGTYFWSVVGMRGGQAVAESGLAAFVVQTP